MSNLTEQWKKGELPEGFYYIIDDEGVVIDYYLCDYWERHSDSDVHQVLAPVPSYEEWKDTENRSLLTTEFSNEIDELNEENQQLKELLERASYCIIGYRHNDHLPERVFYEEEVSNLLEEIDNAIGEKK